MFDAFISFSFKDLELAELILNTLTNTYGIKAWMCTHDIQGGRKYKKEIVDAIESSKVFVLLQSSASVSSEQVPNEVAIALDYGKTVIPFVIDDSRLSGDLYYDLVRVQRVDATMPPIEERIEELAKNIKSAIKDYMDDNLKNAKTEDPDKTSVFLNSREPIGNRFFAGREDVLQEIETAFLEGHRIVFLRGMGGIGKSEIAIQYAKRNRSQYKTIVFARYEKSLASTIADDNLFYIDGFVRKITANGDIQTDEEYALDKINFIAEYCGQDTLLILDNYDVDSDQFFNFLVWKGAFRLLVSTRNDQPESKGHAVIHVREIEDDDTLKRIFITNANPEYTCFDEDDPAFEELFAITARHTLALELVAQMAEEIGCNDIGEVVFELKKQGLGALKEVSGAYEIIASLVRNIKLNEDEKELLMSLQLMPAGGIDRTHFKRWCSESVYKSHVRLLKRSAVKYDARTGLLSLHPIIREVLKQDMPPVFSCCKVFLSTFTSELIDYISWNYSVEEKRVYYDCCKNILSYFDSINKETYPLYCQIGNFFRFADSISSKKIFFSQLLNRAKELFSEKSYEYSLALYYYGHSEKLSLHFFYAEQLLSDSYLALEKYVNSRIADLSGCDAYVKNCCDLAGLYIDYYSGNKDSEEKWLALADELLERATKALPFFTEKDEIVYGCRSGLISYVKARRLMLNGENGYSAALRLLEEASRSYYATAYVDQAMLMYRMAKILYEIRDYKESLECINKSIDGYLFGNELGDIGLIGERICSLFILRVKCYIHLNQLNDAIQYCREALLAIDKVFEKQSSDYQNLFNDLFSTLAENLEECCDIVIDRSKADYNYFLQLLDSICVAETGDANIAGGCYQ